MHSDCACGVAFAVMRLSTLPSLARPSRKAASGTGPSNGGGPTIGRASMHTRATGTVNRATTIPDSALKAGAVPCGHRLTVLFEPSSEFAYTAVPGHRAPHTPLVRLRVTPMREYALLMTVPVAIGC